MATTVFISLWLFTLLLTIFLVCQPLAKFWNPLSPGKCINIEALSYYGGISNLVTDVWLFLLPVPLIVRLHVSRPKKIGLSVIFTIGLG